MYDAIVLAGGRASRLDGADKAALTVGGATLLDRVLAAVAGARRTVAVGPVRPTCREVTWTREQPPGGGPVAGLAAGLARTDAPTVLVLAADLPWIGPAVPLLLAACTPGEPALVVDATGRANHLAAAWPRPLLAAALDAVGDPAGAAMRSLVHGYVPVADTGGWGTDCDTWADVRAAQELGRKPT